MRALLLSLVLVCTLAGGDDPYCPRYPQSVRSEMEEIQSLDRDFQAYSRMARRATGRNAQTAAGLAGSGNFIDQAIAKKMNTDGVTPAGPTNDSEFLRRVSLDLTGRIPGPDKTAAFLSEIWPDKRGRL